MFAYNLKLLRCLLDTNDAPACMTMGNYKFMYDDVTVGGESQSNYLSFLKYLKEKQILW